MSTSLLNVMQDAVLSAPNGTPAKKTAELVRKPYNTLIAELNESVPTNKFGMDLLIPLMQATGSLEPLHYLAAAMGGEFVPLPKPGGDVVDLRDQCLLSAQDLGRLVEDFREAIEDGVIESHEFAIISRDGRKIVRDVLAFVQAVAAQVKSNRRKA